MRSIPHFSQWRQDPINERLAINSRVVLAITRSGSFAGEVRWQNENFAGIRFLEDASVVEERLRAMLG